MTIIVKSIEKKSYVLQECAIAEIDSELIKPFPRLHHRMLVASRTGFESKPDCRSGHSNLQISLRFLVIASCLLGLSASRSIRQLYEFSESPICANIKKTAAL
jgi:hypothetical protein